MSDSSLNTFHLPRASFWWSGGLSLVLLPLLAFIFRGQNFSWLNTWLLAIFSYTHFALSASWFYGSRAVRARHWFVSYGSPAVMLAIGFLLYQSSDEIIFAAFRIGLVILYWHFAKQAFGTSIWMMRREGPQNSHANGSPFVRNAILASCLCFAAFGLSQAQMSGATNQIFRLYVPAFQLDRWAPEFFLYLGLAFTIFITVQMWRARHSNWNWLLPLTPVVSLLAWMHPSLLVGGLITAPIFHGLQALPFTTMNQNSKLKVLGLLVIGLLFGSLALNMIPNFAASLSNYNGQRLAAIWIFVINMHHFWIESFAWRKSTLALRN